MTPTQELIIESVARTTSAISLAGCLFILLTFALFPAFRKPINRLIVYASIGNILTNSATVVSVAAIPRHGASLALCRFQGFFIQIKMHRYRCIPGRIMTKSAIRNFNAVDLRGLEMRYFALCYGICFIPALVYLCLDLSRLNTGIYSDAVLWCWVGKDWEWMRIAFFYGPVWVVIIITIGIYCYTGRVIFKQRKALRAFSRSNEQPFPPVKNPFNATNAVTATTEVVVTSESIESAGNTKRSDPEADSRSSFSSTRKLSGTTANQDSTYQRHSDPSDANLFSRYEPDSAVWPYSNAVSGARGDTKNVFSTSVSAGTPVPAELLLDFEGPRPSSSGAGNRKPSTAGRHANDAAWGYAKVAFLMFVALFIVWVPSTVNRVYALAKPNETNFALSVVAAFVLPMQGFWNFSIYVSTSWSQCKDAWKEVRDVLFCGAFSRKTTRNADLEMSGALRPPSSKGGIAGSVRSGVRIERRQRGGSGSGRLSLNAALDMDDSERAGSEKDYTISPYSSRPPTSPPTSERGLTGQ
ncbi:hypothetical protein SLS56_005382 [Neofusicoccum ribis]|uniref:G-protein coupled receptor n=1 Tax=Neofusicoccum ribis TaxID=45134 RepID=A0ABR3STJ4_9PEZI